VGHQQMPKDARAMIQDIPELFSCNLVDSLVENIQIEWISLMQPTAA
jgi:hypothetical protein